MLLVAIGVIVYYLSPKKIFLNDNDFWLTKILDYLINNDSNLVIKRTEQIIKKFKLPFNQFLDKYTDEYNNLKKSFNEDKKADKLLVLILYGFKQQKIKKFL